MLQTEQRKLFAERLKEGIQTVIWRGGKPRAVVLQDIHDRLSAEGYTLAFTTVENWLRGRGMPDPTEVAWLVRYVKIYGRCTWDWADSLLQRAKFPGREAFLQQLFADVGHQTSARPGSQGPPQGAGGNAPLFSGPPLLPLRPRRLFGRAEALQILRQVLENGSPGLYVITGVPGVGKNALAAELVYADPHIHSLAPDGVISLNGRSWQGQSGLVAFLAEFRAWYSDTRSTEPDAEQQILREAYSILASKRLLILLNDLHPDFPLVEALKLAPLSLVVVTSRKVPVPGLAQYHLPLPPLDLEAASEMLTHLIERSLPECEQPAIKQLCELVGCLPGALEWVAQAINLSVEPHFLATHLSRYDLLLVEGEGLHTRFVQAVKDLPPDLKERLARLAPLGTDPFAVEDAAWLLHQPEAIWKADSAPVSQHQPEGGPGGRVQLATAADLARLAGHSVLHVDPQSLGQFRLPPLFQAVAADIQRRHYEETLSLAAQHRMSLPTPHRDRVLSALAYAWYSRNYRHVIELTYSLYQAIGHLPYQHSERLLRWAIAASHQLQERFFLIRFITRLGKLRLYQGDLTSAERFWREAADLAEPEMRHAAPDRLVGLLMVWSNLTLIPAFRDEIEEARHRSMLFKQKSEEIGSAFYVADGYQKIAFYDRLAGRWEQAHNSLEAAIRLSSDQSENLYRLAEMQLEQARIEGAYERSAQLVEQLIALTEPAVQADSLYDQAIYALSQGQREDANKNTRRSLGIARGVGAHLMAGRSQKLLAQFST